MKYAVLISVAAVLWTASGHAQTRIFRCGNTYTNDVNEAQAKGCKPLDGGNVTVFQGTRVQTAAVRPTAASPSPSGTTPGPSQRVETGDQRARDSDARLILESELKKSEARQADLVREYNNGEPEKLGPETRNHQKYLDRVAELKASIARNESDITSIKRELSRLTASK